MAAFSVLQCAFGYILSVSGVSLSDDWGAFVLGADLSMTRFSCVAKLPGDRNSPWHDALMYAKNQQWRFYSGHCAIRPACAANQLFRQEFHGYTSLTVELLGQITHLSDSGAVKPRIRKISR